MHVGAEASHGHYLAHIQEASSGDWFKFSDNIVEKIAGGKLGNENDPMNGDAGKKTPKAPKIPKGFQASNNAYMLVYTEKKNLDKIREEEALKLETRERIKKRGEKEMRMKANEAERPPKRRKRQVAAEETDAKRRKVSTPSGGKDGVQTDHQEQSEEACHNSEEDEEENISEADVQREKAYTFVDGLVYPNYFPIYLRAYIEQDRQQLQEEIEQYMMFKVRDCRNVLLFNAPLSCVFNSQEHRKQEREETREKVREIIEEMCYEDRIGELLEEYEDGDEEKIEDIPEFQFLPTDWLARYLDSPDDAGPIDTTNLLCFHGNLDLDKVNEVKLLKSDAVS